MRTIIALCRILEVECEVEGVETEEQMHTVDMHGCRFIQGFFFAKPVTREMVPQVIERIERSGGQAKRGRQATVPLLP
jgi:EAL domain-containing protein (putative c-di-GMP-specific phosphodiesterase class I)